jgi:hypothetical protein
MALRSGDVAPMFGVDVLGADRNEAVGGTNCFGVLKPI